MYENDRRLVVDMLKGDQRAFDAFFNTYAPRLASFIARRSRLDRDNLQDVVQVSLIKAIRGLRGFRGESALFSWLCQIGSNELFNLQRRSPSRAGHESVDSEGAARDALLALRAPSELEPGPLLESDQLNDSVRRVLNEMPKRQAMALEYKYGDGLSVEEIGMLLGITTIAAQSILARARVEFRDCWTKELSLIAAVDPTKSGAGSR